MAEGIGGGDAAAGCWVVRIVGTVASGVLGVIDLTEGVVVGDAGAGAGVNDAGLASEVVVLVMTCRVPGMNAGSTPDPGRDASRPCTPFGGRWVEQAFVHAAGWCG